MIHYRHYRALVGRVIGWSKDVIDAWDWEDFAEEYAEALRLREWGI